MDNKNLNDIWVYVEVNNQQIEKSTLQLLAKGKQLSKKTNGKLCAILLKDSDINYEEILIGHHADEVITVLDHQFKTFNPSLYGEVIAKLAEKYQPSIFLFGATYQGRSLAPMIQGTLKTGLTADCLDLDIDKNMRLLQIKPSYGDNLMCTIISDKNPQMATVRPNVFKENAFNQDLVGKIINEDIQVDINFKYQEIKREKIIKDTESIEDAKVVVAVGRGIKNQENLVYIEQLAKLLKAKIGVSRPLAENGWYTLDEQIGQSGTTISADVLLNFGISGALQYTSGIKDCKYIFSVNTDKDALIFKESNYGALVDASELAKQLIKDLSK